MFDNFKRFISKFTDKPIYKGVGVTSMDEIRGNETTTDGITLYKLNGTKHIYSFQRVSVGKKSGVIYYILESNNGSKEEMVVSASVFNEIFTRIAN